MSLAGRIALNAALVFGSALAYAQQSVSAQEMPLLRLAQLGACPLESGAIVQDC